MIYLEFSTRQLAALGINQNEVIATLQAQNAIAPSGVVQAEGERVSVRVNGQFSSEDSLRAVNLQVNNRFFRLTDIATISRAIPIRRRLCSAITASPRSALPSA